MSEPASTGRLLVVALSLVSVAAGCYPVVLVAGPLLVVLRLLVLVLVPGPGYLNQPPGPGPRSEPEPEPVTRSLSLDQNSGSVLTRALALTALQHYPVFFQVDVTPTGRSGPSPKRPLHFS
eukprot:740403-Rhodomonas_salina.1